MVAVADDSAEADEIMTLMKLMNLQRLDSDGEVEVKDNSAESTY